MDERLRDLVRKWRAQELDARRAMEAGEGREWRSEARVLKDCADDLANLLTDIRTSTPAPAVERRMDEMAAETVGGVMDDEPTQPYIDPPKWVHVDDPSRSPSTSEYIYFGDGLFMRHDLTGDEMKAAYEEAMFEMRRTGKKS